MLVQLYWQRHLLSYIPMQGLMYLVAVTSYYCLLLGHPAGLWDEHSPRNTGMVEGLGLIGVWLYSVVSRRSSRSRAWKAVALDQVRGSVVGAGLAGMLAAPRARSGNRAACRGSASPAPERRACGCRGGADLLRSGSRTVRAAG